MNLIDFLLRNWFIVIILIMGVSSMRKRLRAEAEKQRRGGIDRMPSFGGQSPAEQQMPSVHPTHTMESLEEGHLAAKEENTRADRAEQKKESTSRNSARISAQPEAKSAPRRNRGLQITSDSEHGYNPVVQGIIWSEVLGPPRAKNPYRRR